MVLSEKERHSQLLYVWQLNFHYRISLSLVVIIRTASLGEHSTIHITPQLLLLIVVVVVDVHRQ